MFRELVNVGKGKKYSPEKIYAREEFARIAHDNGWLIEKNRGKGGHWWFRKEGRHPFPVPDVIGRGLQERIKKWLGIK